MKPIMEVRIFDGKPPRYHNGFGYRYNKISRKKKKERFTKNFLKTLMRTLGAAYCKDLRKTKNGKLYINLFSCTEAVWSFNAFLQKYYRVSIGSGTCAKIIVHNKYYHTTDEVYIICVPVGSLMHDGFSIPEIKFVILHELGHIDLSHEFHGRTIKQELEADLYAANIIGYENAIMFLRKYQEKHSVDVKTGEFKNIECFNEINMRLENLREKLTNKNR